MSDLIRREDAIDAIVRQTNYDNVDVIRYECRKNYEKDNGWLGGLKEALEAVESLPSAAPERKTGTWKPFDLTWGRSVYSCTACGEAMDIPTEMSKPIYSFCPNCGAEMTRGE